MNSIRLALANIQFPQTPDESVTLAEDAIARASASGADIVCFPECFVPGYRGLGHVVAPPDPVFLERAWSAIAGAAARIPSRKLCPSSIVKAVTNDSPSAPLPGGIQT